MTATQQTTAQQTSAQKTTAQQTDPAYNCNAEGKHWQDLPNTQQHCTPDSSTCKATSLVGNDATDETNFKRTMVAMGRCLYIYSVKMSSASKLVLVHASARGINLRIDTILSKQQAFNSSWTSLCHCLYTTCHLLSNLIKYTYSPTEKLS